MPPAPTATLVTPLLAWQDELVYPESVSSIFRINDEIYSAATGMRGDVLYQVNRSKASIRNKLSLLRCSVPGCLAAPSWFP